MLPVRMYMIPGTGADKRLFRLFDPGMAVHYLEWIAPLPDESLAGYALRLCSQVDMSQPFILGGVSLGGMLAVEMSKHIPAQKVVLISSIKTRSEMPWYFRFFSRVHIYKLFPAGFLRRLPQLIRPFFGRMNKGEYNVYVDMLQHTDVHFLNWAQKAILQWQNTEAPPNVLHLHGTQDVIFPIRYIHNCIPIKGGQHYMIVRRVREINRILQEQLAADGPLPAAP